MTVYQLPAEVGAFARYLGEVAARLVPGRGWYGVFADRDPEGLRACFDGTEILPWDVVESLLQDLGESPAGPEATRARALHRAAAAAHDRRPGGAEALRERLAAMEHERRYAEARTRELAARLGEVPGAPDDRTADELAWARDDHARATSRVTDLTARLAALAPDPGRVPSAVAATPRRKPRGARYAWLDDVEEAPAPGPAVELPVAGAAPRGARYGGGEAASGLTARTARTARTAPAVTPEVEETAQDAGRAAANAVYALRRLRAQGRSGEAHALLCEAVAGPTGRLPALAAELHRVGLGADWATLLWEAASLPPGRLAAVAGVLADAGRTADCEHLLRQGVARPVGDLAGACAALRAEGHHREAQALLTAFLRVRTPEDAAQLAAADPDGLPQLRAAARAVSPARERDLLHALRVAGLAGT
ncbi:UL36 very large tegument protein [Streptomyces sp. NPDC090127]|uniref:UL36 very large tegument protein n=1 Tax=Streptomyces sp. NPDC090127 TaxID=3365953 RepID=UPI00382AFA53